MIVSMFSDPGWLLVDMVEKVFVEGDVMFAWVVVIVREYIESNREC